MTENRTVMKISSLTKTFGPVVALDNVSLEVRRGEVRGLIGENGSGKSTVTSIFSGMQGFDSGKMEYMGKLWRPRSMHDALLHGVGMIVQENGTVPGITVAENLFLNDSRRFSKGKFVSGSDMTKAAQNALDEIGADHIDAKTVTGKLDMQDRKLAEVAKVMLHDPQILVVDETTTALSQRGRDIIYGLMQRMKDEDKAVVFISHDLDEIMEKCDTLTVLRDGKIIRTFEKNEFDADLIRTSMIGRQLQGDYYRSDVDPTHFSAVSVEVRDVTLGDKLKGVSFEAYKGEILGIGGLSSCGMHTLGKVLFGAEKPTLGSVLVNGKPLKDPRSAMKAGVGYAAKDRDVESLCLAASIKDNISSVGMDKFATAGFLLLPQKEKKYVAERIGNMQVKCFSPNQPVSELSGGNKQKVVFSKWLGYGSDILVLDCPTRGIDIGVKQMMYSLMYKMKNEGKTIIMISEELSELIGMSDRLLIMKDGRVTKEFFRNAELSDADIIGYMV